MARSGSLAAKILQRGASCKVCSIWRTRDRLRAARPNFLATLAPGLRGHLAQGLAERGDVGAELTF